MALKTAREKGRPLLTLGPLIHNKQAVSSLESEGIQSAETADEVPSGATVIIRAHGIRPEMRKSLEDRDIEVVDATCPHVVASQRRIAERSSAGFSVVIVGDRDHAEIRGLVGHAQGAYAVISSVEEVESIRLPGPLCIIAQTTFSETTYHLIVAEARKLFPGIEVFESICSSTEDRQREVREMAERLDAIVVVGARHSANTLRLAEIARASGRQTVHVETVDELDITALSAVEAIGVTAGASTPSWVISEVLEALTRGEASE